MRPCSAKFQARESSDNPRLNAFCRVAPSVRFSVLAILAAVNKYVEYLDRADMFFKDPPDTTSDDPGYLPLVVSTALVVTAHPIFGTDITLIDGPCHRLYGMGVDPDPEERGPTTPPKSAERRRAPHYDPFPA